MMIKNETLYANKTTIDLNISNDIVEWVINNQSKDLVDFNDPDSSVVSTGLMTRGTAI